MTYTKHPESLRLADWLDDQYDQDHHKADAAAELRRLHAIETALQQGYDAARLEIESLRDEVKEYRHGAGVQKALIETLLADSVLEDAARYRLVRRGQHWSVINGVGDTLRAEELDAAIDAAHPAVPVAQGDALTDTYVQQVPDKCDRIVWRGRYYHLPIDAAEHSYTEPSPMAKVAAALRQKAEQEDAAYQARRSDQGLMESEWGPMEDAPPHEDPPMHVAVVEGDDTVRTLQWNRDVAAFAYPAGTLLYAARSQAKEGA